MNRRVLSTFILLLGVFSTSFAQIKESSDGFVGRREHNLLHLLSDNFGFPDTEMIAGEATVSVLVEGPKLTILAVGPIKGDAKSYANALETWRVQSHLGGQVEYSQEDDCASAQLVVSNGGFGKMEATLAFNLGDLTKAVEKIEPKTSVALLAPRYTQFNINAPPDYTSSNGTRYWNVSKSGISGDLISTLTVPGWVVPALIAWFTLPILGLAVSFAIGFTIARNQNLPIAQRRKAYGSWVMKGTFGTLGLHAVLVVLTLPTKALEPVSQMWFGLRFTQVGLMIVPFFAIGPMIALPMLNKTEQKLLGPTEEEKAQKEDFSEYDASAEDKAAIKTGAWKVFAVKMVPLAVVFPLVFLVNLPRTSPYYFAQRMAFPTALFASLILGLVLQATTKKKSQATNQRFDHLVGRVEQRAQSIGDRMSVSVPKVRVTPLLQGPYGAAISSNQLMVTPAMADRFSDDELDFILAHELAHKKAKHVPKRLFMAFAIAFIPMLFFVALMSGKSFGVNISPTFYLSPFLIIFVAMVAGRPLISSSYQKNEFAVDEAAVRLLRNKDAAISALTKVARQNGLPGFNDVDFMQSHPAMAKRIERIRALAI
ncbi:MAG: M48 family metalloprotease [Armatimonadetes bacterium]|nr:M48 family metalloprotease [Armatimonadota bacterium]